MGKDVKGELRKLGNLEINILIICTYCYCLLMLKLYYVQELFPIKVDKRVPFHAKFNENYIFYPIICLKYLLIL